MEEQEELERWFRSQSQGNLKKPKKIKRKLLSPYSSSGGLEHLKSQNKKSQRKLARPVALPSLRHSPTYSKEDLAAKTIALPYADNYLLIEESFRVIDEWSPKKRSHVLQDNSSPAHIFALCKRYPRFCEGLNFIQDSSCYKCRSDLWLVRIMEESYDAVMCECTKKVSENRARQRYNLDLGALDSFPQSVRRFISQKYSVLNILPQICMEILLAIDRVLSVSDRVCMNRQIDEGLVCDSGRVFLFSAFLSEEMDVDRLAAFLQIRDICQDAAGFLFKDVIAHMQHPIPTRAGHSEESPDLVDLIDSTKICPLKLPFNLRIMKDASMPEAPLLAVDFRTLSVICHRVAPHSTANSIKYLIDKILFWVATLIERKSSIFRLLEYLREDSYGFLHCHFHGSVIDGLRVIPLHVIIWAITTEFGYYKGNQHVSVAEALHGNGPKEVTTSDQGLAVLNRLYDNNREILHVLDAEINEAELNFSHWKGKLLDLEKQKRRIERKWKEYQPDFDLRGMHARVAEENKGYDLKELSQLKMLLLEAEEERATAEALVKRLKKKRITFNADIDSLWKSTLSGGTSQKKAGGLKSGKMDWKEIILKRVSEAVDYNASFHHDSRDLNISPDFQAKSLQDPAEPVPIAVAEVTEEIQAPEELSLLDQMAVIEAEAKKLAELCPDRRILITEVDLAGSPVQPVQSSPASFSSLAHLILSQTMASSLILAITGHFQKTHLGLIQGTEQETRQSPQNIDRPPSGAGIVAQPLNVGLFLFEDPFSAMKVDEYIENRLYRMSAMFIHKVWRQCLATRRFRRYRRSSLTRALSAFRNHLESSRHVMFRHDIILTPYLMARQSSKMIASFKIWRKTARYFKKLKNRSIVILQCLARKFLARIRVRRVRAALERREKAIQMSLMNIEKLQLKRAVQRLVKWRNYHQSLRKADRLIRVRKLVPSFLTWKRLYSQIIIAYAIRQSLARRNLKSRRKKAIILGEYFAAVPYLLAKNRAKRVFRHWRTFKVVNVIFRLTYRKALNTKLSRSLEKWKISTSAAIAKRNSMATKIQSAYRMHLSIKYDMDFYTVRRGMIALQSVVRRRIATEVVAVARRRHLSAISLQKIVRGYTLRIQLRRKRIQDIHEAAKSNNYERLLYYCDFFYNLTFQLDENGYTALHNAAKYASKRCIKLLMKYYHDPSVLTPEGYTPLHLLIMSSAPARDEVFDYMIEVGFDEDLLTPDGKNALLLAAEYGRIRIAIGCLKEGQDPNLRAHDGSTAIQYACQNGYEPLVRALIEHGANVNLPGYGGMYPLHDVTYCGDVEIANQLIAAGAEINVSETVSGWTPLMMACRNGQEKLVDLFLSQLPDVLALDYSWCNAAHHCAVSNSIRIANSLREVDVDFYALDYEGNSPLHYAAQYGSVDVMREFLFSGAPASLQNHHGNQPSHIAAQYNQVECLKLLSLYDQHMGRMNYSHQTPLGVAKFHLAHGAQKFLEDYFTKIDVAGIRNQDGDIWWDKEIDSRLGDWKQVIDEANHRHFVNLVTGEISLEPPSIATSSVQQIAGFAQVPMRMKVLPQEEENRLNRKVYDTEYEDTKHSIEEARKVYRAATVITKFARRKIAYAVVAKKRKAIRQLQVLGRFVRRATDVLMKWKIVARTKKWIRVQALFRGYSARCHFYYWDGTYQLLWYELAKRRLAKTIWTLWKNYKLHLLQTTVHVAATAPRLLSEWEKILDLAGYPVRVVGLYEDYLYPGTTKIHFYRNIETGLITFHKPKEIEKRDLMEYRSRQMMIEHGYTPAQLKLALKLQALWRGHKIRRMYVFITKATSICVNAEQKFLTDPESDRNLFNYTLFCHVVKNDYDRARPLYIEAMRRMTFKGPDIAQILYAYAIFAFVVHDQDVEECLDLVMRGRKAEILHYNLIRKQEQRNLELGGRPGSIVNKPTTPVVPASRGGHSESYVDIEITVGKSFELANVGFFRYMCNLRGTSEAYHNYAACRFLVYGDFPGAFDAFMGAFKHDPMNTKLRDNYNAMMRHFFGRNQNLIDEEVNRRMRILADKDHQEKVARQERIDLWNHKLDCACTIQKWYRHHRDMFRFRMIVDKLRRKKPKGQVL